MICNDCGMTIPADSKFCPSCGAFIENSAPQEGTPATCTGCGLQLPAGSKFCPVCGTPATAVSAEAQAEPSAQSMPAIQPTAPAGSDGFGGYGGMSAVTPLSRTAQSDSIKALVESMGLMAEPDTAESRVELTKPVESVHAQETAVKPSDNVPHPSNSYTKPSDSIFGAPNEPKQLDPLSADPSEMLYSQNARPSDGISSFSSGASVTYNAKTDGADTGSFEAGAFGSTVAAVSLTPVKKSKAWIGFLIGGIFAALIAACAIIFFTNKGAVMHAFMGDEGYARMIEANSIQIVTDALSEPAAAESLKAIGLSAAEAIAQEELWENDIYSTSPEMTLETVLSTLHTAMLTSYGTNGAELTLDADVSLTDTTIGLLGDENENIDDILKLVNSSRLKFYVLTAEDSLSADITLSDDEGFSANARGIVCSDGTTGIVFPFASDSCIKYVIEQDGTVTEEEIPSLEIDGAEVARLLTEIVQLYLEYYEQAEITVTDAAEDTEHPASDSFTEGKHIDVVFTGEMVESFVASIAELLANDEYFCNAIVEYLNANDVEFTKDDYADVINEYFKDATCDDDDSLTISTCVDKNNNILSKSWKAADGEETVTLLYAKTDKGLILNAYEDTTPVFFMETETSSESEGEVEITFFDDEGVQAFGLKIAYSDFVVARFAGKPLTTYNAKLSFVIPVSLTQDDYYGELMNVLYSTTIGMSNSVSGDTLTQGLEISVPQYGSVKFTCAATPVDAPPAEIPADAIVIADDSFEQPIDTEVTERCTALITQVKEAIDGMHTDSKYVEVLSEVCQDLLDELEYMNSPLADPTLVQELSNEAIEYYYAADDLLSEYSDLITDEQAEELRECSEEFFDVYMEIDYEGLTQKKYDALRSRLNSEIRVFTAIQDEVNHSVNQVDLTEKYNSMSFEELSDEYVDVSTRLFMLAETYSDVMQSDGTLYALYEEAFDIEQELLDAMIDFYADGAGSVPKVREMRKIAARFEAAVIKLETAITNNKTTIQ